MLAEDMGTNGQSLTGIRAARFVAVALLAAAAFTAVEAEQASAVAAIGRLRLHSTASPAGEHFNVLRPSAPRIAAEAKARAAKRLPASLALVGAVASANLVLLIAGTRLRSTGRHRRRPTVLLRAPPLLALSR